MVEEIKFDFINIVRDSDSQYQIVFGITFREQEKQMQVGVGVAIQKDSLTPETIEEKKLECIKFLKSCAAIPENKFLEAYGAELPNPCPDLPKSFYD